MERYEDSRIETRLRHWSRAGITLGVLLTGLGYVASWRAMRQAAAEADWVTHGHAVRTAIEATLAHATEVETGAHGFAATGEQTFLDPFLEGQNSLAPDLDTLHFLTTDNPAQQERVERLRAEINARLENARKTIAERQRTGTIPAIATLLEGKERMDAVRATIGAMQAEEARLLDQRTRRAYAARRWTEAVTLISALAGATLLLVAGFITSREISRSVKMRGQIEELNASLEQRVEGRTGELRESEARLRLFIEHAPAALAMFDREMRYLQVSRRWLADYRIHDRDVRGVSHYEVFPEVPERWKEGHRRGLAGGIVREESDRFERQDGTVQWIRWEIRPWYEANGAVGGIVVFSEDMTAAKQAEEGLRQSEERLRALVNASSDVVYRMSPDWSEMRQLDGRGFIADTSAPIRDWIPAYIHPDDQVLVTRTIQNAIRNKGVFELEHRVRQTDGGLGWTLSRAVPRLDANGEIIEWIGMASNVTPRKLAEEAIRESRARLAAALASMTDAVFISDAQGRFIEFNDAFATFHRFKSKADCAQTLAEYPSFLDVFMPNGDLAPLDMWAVPRALRGETVTDAEYTLRRKDTGETWVGNYSFAPIRDKDRVIVGSVVVGRDITQKKANEREIRQLNEELERRVHERTAELEAANKELEAFTYSVSHDLRAPLRHISGFSQILTEEFAASLPPEAQRHLQRIEEGTRHMGQLVDDLLNLARIGRRDLTLQVTGLKSVVEEVIRSLKSDIGDRQVEWRIGNLPYVDCDTALMTQVFQNLLSNALKFTRPRAQAVIDVGLEEKDGTSLVYVRDNGVGFSMKYADKLFGVFQRLHRQEDFEGTGVGLATVQRIIQKHGGRIWADAELDKGATFYFTLGTSEITGNKAKSAVAGDQV